MLGHVRGEIAPQDAQEAGIVLDLLRIEELAAGDAPLEHDGLEHAAPGIHGRAESGRPAADDDDLE